MATPQSVIVFQGWGADSLRLTHSPTGSNSGQRHSTGRLLRN